MSFSIELLIKWSLMMALLTGGESCLLADAPITALAALAGGDCYVIGSQSGIHVRDAENHKRLRTLESHLEQVHDLCFSTDGKYLVAAGGVPGERGTVEIYTWPQADLIRSIQIYDDIVYRVIGTNDGKGLLATSHSNQCGLMSLEGSDRVNYTGHSGPVLAALSLPTRKWFVSGGVDQTIQIWSEAGERLRAFNNHTGSVTDLAVQVSDNQDILLLSSSEDHTVRLWQPAIGRLVRFLRLDSVPRRVAWFSETDLVVGCDNGTVVWIDSNEMKVLGVGNSQIKPIYELVRFRNGVLVAGVGGVEFVPFSFGNK